MEAASLNANLPPGVDAGRRDQTFPVLTAAEIARIQRFGKVVQYRRGDRLVVAGEPGPGMLVVLKGAVTISQRDGMGHVTPIARHGPGQFLGEVGQLSGKPALVDGVAEEDVEALLVPPDQLRALIIAEADLGERLVRALILRRVALIQAGATGPVLIGQPQSAGVIRLQSFLSRNGYPHHVLDVAEDADAAALHQQYGAATGEVLTVCPDGSVLLNPTRNRARPLHRHGRHGRPQRAVRCGRGGRRPGRPGDRRVRRVGRLAGAGARLQGVRRAGRCQCTNRKLPGLSDRHLGPGPRRPRLCAGAEVRCPDADSGAGPVAGLHAHGPRRRIASRARGRATTACQDRGR